MEWDRTCTSDTVQYIVKHVLMLDHYTSVDFAFLYVSTTDIYFKVLYVYALFQAQSLYTLYSNSVCHCHDNNVTNDII